MKPIIAVFDDFLPNAYVGLTAKRGDFKSAYNVEDGVTYDGISRAVDPNVRRHIRYAMARLFGQIEIKHQFARLMTKDHPQSLIHSDHVMGDFSLHIFLSPNAPETCGTQFWWSPVFGSRNEDKSVPIDAPKFFNPSNWHRRTFIKAQLNRALLHDSSLWHSAEPALGFGTDQFDGRLVLTTFFNAGVS